MLERIEIVPGGPHVARVLCAGEFEDNSAGNAAGGQLTEAIAAWLAAHRDLEIRELDVDFRAVAYVTGNAPVTAFIQLLRSGIVTVRLWPSAESRKSLEGLVRASNMGYFIRIMSNSEPPPC